jgi:hypothetical protein
VWIASRVWSLWRRSPIVTMPEIGERVTVVVRNLVMRKSYIVTGVVSGRLAGEWERGLSLEGFTVELDPGDPTTAVNLWELDSEFVEGVGWARGWDGPAVEALKVAEALA